MIGWICPPSGLYLCWHLLSACKWPLVFIKLASTLAWKLNIRRRWNQSIIGDIRHVPAPSISSNWAIKGALARPEGSRSDCGELVENCISPPAVGLPTPSGEGGGESDATVKTRICMERTTRMLNGNIMIRAHILWCSHLVCSRCLPWLILWPSCGPCEQREIKSSSDTAGQHVVEILVVWLILVCECFYVKEEFGQLIWQTGAKSDIRAS